MHNRTVAVWPSIFVRLLDDVPEEKSRKRLFITIIFTLFNINYDKL